MGTVGTVLSAGEVVFSGGSAVLEAEESDVCEFLTGTSFENVGFLREYTPIDSFVTGAELVGATVFGASADL